jgi:serine/threonine protein kinase
LTSYKATDFIRMNHQELIDACLELVKRTLIAEGLRTTHRTLLTPHRPPQSFESSESSVYKHLGEGGFGEVTKAIGSLDKKSVAIKVVPINDSGMEFKREVRIHAGLPAHPNLVQYFCSAIAPGKNPDSLKGYIHMELCNGGNLESFLGDTVHVEGDTERLKRLEQLLGLFKDCATGLEVLHSMHIVHRDIKPANIFLVEDDQGCLSAKLGDFGLSCQVEDEVIPGGSSFFTSPDPQPDTSSDVSNECKMQLDRTSTLNPQSFCFCVVYALDLFPWLCFVFGNL